MIQKRHHWWPQLHSGNWCSSRGKITVVRADGNTFSTSPANIGAETHLYTMLNFMGEVDTSIETWLSEHVDGPFDAIFEKTFGLSNILSDQIAINPEQARISAEIGYKPMLVSSLQMKREYVRLDKYQREIVARYIASLVVRTPRYLERIGNMHTETNGDFKKTITLKNMTYMYEKYKAEIIDADFMLVVADGSHRFLFSDAGIIAKEPWNVNNVPFDIHIPLSPRIALQVLPVPDPHFRDRIPLVRALNSGVARHNRIMVGAAKRFVFADENPPIDFIVKNFGIPAPAPHAHRYMNGRLETYYEPSLDRPKGNR